MTGTWKTRVCFPGAAMSFIRWQYLPLDRLIPPPSLSKQEVPTGSKKSISHTPLLRIKQLLPSHSTCQNNVSCFDTILSTASC
uniref:Uncharacterized protein n=1 Tax=Oryzias sinensis TaxID=183150 RepID=A0A8C8E390_9TELE